MSINHLIFNDYDEFAAWLDRFRQEKVGAEIRGTENYVMLLFDRSQFYCPVLTGLLKSTGRVVNVGPDRWLISYGDPGLGCDYARHVYYGHFSTGGRWVPGRPWIRWAIEDMRGEWAQEQVNQLRRIR